MRMTWGTNTIDFFYDANGTPYAMKYNGTVYYYITNLQGDVMRIVDGSQNIVTSYDYDPYGSSGGSCCHSSSRSVAQAFGRMLSAPTRANLLKLHKCVQTLLCDYPKQKANCVSIKMKF